MDLGLEVKQFAKQLGVCEQTVINLEMNRSQSRPRILKSVVEFLKPHVNGFMPEKEFWGFCFKNNVSYPKEHNTLGEKLRVTRMQSFLSIKQLAKQLKVAPTSIGKWERMESNPLPKSKDQIMSWLISDFRESYFIPSLNDSTSRKNRDCLLKIKRCYYLYIL